MLVDKPKLYLASIIKVDKPSLNRVGKGSCGLVHQLDVMQHHLARIMASCRMINSNTWSHEHPYDDAANYKQCKECDLLLHFLPNVIGQARRAQA